MYSYLLCFLIIFSPAVQALQKQALVIGNGAYPGQWQLYNPVNDAVDVASALKDLGFKVTLLTDGNKRSMSNAVQSFASGLQNGDVALFYFSGHGFSGKDQNIRDTNFLVGSFQFMVKTQEHLKEESLNANFVVNSLRRTNTQGINIIILDACRDVPLGFLDESKGIFEEGLVSLGKYERFIMNYATQHLKKALGSKNQRNSTYTQYLIDGLRNRNLTRKNITEFFNEVGLMVSDKYGDKQTPLVETSPVRFCLAECPIQVTEEHQEISLIGQTAQQVNPPTLAVSETLTQSKYLDYSNWKVQRTFMRHDDSGWLVTIMPNGHTALSTTRDNTLKLWSLTTGEELRTFSGHKDVILSVAVAPNGRRILSGSADNTLKLWDLTTGKVLRTFIGHAGSIRTVAITPDGRRILSGSADNTLKLWDLATGKVLRTFTGHKSTVSSVAIAPDGHTALSGGWDNTLRYWDLMTGKELRIFYGYKSPVHSVAFTPNGRAALSGSSDNTLKLWDLATGKELHTFSGHSALITSVTFTPDGRSILSGSYDKTLKLWDLATGKELHTFMGQGESIHSVAIAPDGRSILSLSRDGMLVLWGSK